MSVEEQLSSIKNSLETLTTAVNEVKKEVNFITHQQQNTVAHVGKQSLKWDRATVVQGSEKVLKWSGVMDRKKIPDGQLSASSLWDKVPACHARHGRLNGKTGCAAWCAASNSDEWIQVDYLKDVDIGGVATQGRGDGQQWPGAVQWVKSFTVEYRKDGENFFNPVTDKLGKEIVFNGNTDRFSVVVNQFPEVVRGRYFKINVKTFHNAVSMRFEFLTCENTAFGSSDDEVKKVQPKVQVQRYDGYNMM